MAWKNKPSNFSFNIKADAEKLIKNIAGDVLQTVITGSPVDSGAFRSNHIVSIDTPDLSTSPINGNTAPRGTLDQQTFSKGAAQILKARLGNLVYIQNNLPYAMKLEEGNSEQAREGIYSLAFLSVKEKYGG